MHRDSFFARSFDEGIRSSAFTNVGRQFNRYTRVGGLRLSRSRPSAKAQKIFGGSSDGGGLHDGQDTNRAIQNERACASLGIITRPASSSFFEEIVETEIGTLGAGAFTKRRRAEEGPSKSLTSNGDRLKKIFALVVALIVYGSLYPWQFHDRALSANPLWTLLNTSWPTTINRFFLRDFLVNVALYGPYGAFGFLALSNRLPMWSKLLLTVVSGMVMSSCIEMLQLYDANRSCSISDVVCNTVGATIGAVGAIFWAERIRKALGRAQPERSSRANGALALSCLWLGAEFFPFFPDFTKAHFMQGISALIHPVFRTPIPLLHGLGAWVALGALTERIFVNPRVARNVLLLATAVFPARLMLLDRVNTGAEILGAFLGIGCWLLFLRRQRSGEVLAGWITIGAVFAAGFAPYRLLAVSGGFSWIPFAAVLDTPGDSGFQILFEKAYLYGASIWLLGQGRAETRWKPAIGVLAALGFVEMVQTHIPGRTAEITDPVLAFLVMAVLAAIEQHADGTQSNQVVR